MSSRKKVVTMLRDYIPSKLFSEQIKKHIQRVLKPSYGINIKDKDESLTETPFSWIHSEIPLVQDADEFLLCLAQNNIKIPTRLKEDMVNLIMMTFQLIQVYLKNIYLYVLIM